MIFNITAKKAKEQADLYVRRQIKFQRVLNFIELLIEKDSFRGQYSTTYEILEALDLTYEDIDYIVNFLRCQGFEVKYNDISNNLYISWG